MNMNCAVGHHTHIDSYSSLAPGVNFGGHTRLGKAVDMGIGACTLQRVTISDYSIVGGQSMVTKSFPENSKIVGVPAR
jgi:serine acetyltransferase